MIKIDLNQLRDRVYKCACNHGFHDEELSNGHWLCLVVSELMEAVEADRSTNRNRRANVDWFKKRIETSRICQGLDPEISKERGYEVVYNETIKGSIEEELADAVIRLLDWYGLRNIVLDNSDFTDDVLEEFAGIYKNKSFTESIFNITKSVTDRDAGTAILKIFGFSKHMGIDLPWHIEQKMRYNELRPIKHGKKY